MQTRLDCTRCEAFRSFDTRPDDPETVVRCASCGKKHSKNSLYVVDPDKRYDRDESGDLTDPRIPT